MSHRYIERTDPSACTEAYTTHTEAHTTHTHTHTDTPTGSSQKQEQRRRVAGSEELSGEAWAELNYSEKEGRVFRE